MDFDKYSPSNKSSGQDFDKYSPSNRSFSSDFLVSASCLCCSATRSRCSYRHVRLSLLRFNWTRFHTLGFSSIYSECQRQRQPKWIEKWFATPFWSDSIVFNENSIASVIATLTLTLSVNGPLNGLRPVYTCRLCIHQIYIVCMVTVRLTVKKGSVPILSVKQPISIDTMINFERDGDEHRDDMCKMARSLPGGRYMPGTSPPPGRYTPLGRYTSSTNI